MFLIKICELKERMLVKMNIQKRKLTITLEEDIEKLEKENQELTTLLNIIKDKSEHRILAGKTQIIGKEGTDQSRSRQKHSKNIYEIGSKNIKGIYNKVIPKYVKDTRIYELNLQKELLYLEIISISHDLGHTPYGHAGERVLNDFVRKHQTNPEDIQKTIQKRIKIFGEEYELRQGHTKNFKGAISFEHNEKSAEIAYNIIQESGINTKYVNVNRIINGILCHSTSRVKEKDVPKDLVIQTVRQDDKIEYINNDYEETKPYINIDAIEEKDIRQFIQKPKKQRINEITEEIVKYAIETGKIDCKISNIKTMRNFGKIHGKIISVLDEDGKGGLVIDENVERITIMIRKVLNYYITHIQETQEEKMRMVHPINEASPEKGQKIILKPQNVDETDIEKLITFICHMDDNQLNQTYMRLAKSRIIQGEGHGIEPITPEEIEQVKQEQLKKQANKIKMKDLQEDEPQRSDDEYLQLVIDKNKRFIETMLTEKGRKKMQESRARHEKEFEIDKQLNLLKKEADEKRNLQGTLSVEEKVEFRKRIEGR